MIRFKNNWLSLLATGCWLLAHPQNVFAQTKSWNLIDLGQDNLGNPIVCFAQDDVATLQGLGCVFYNLLAIVLQGLGLVMFIMILVGGLKYLTAGEDPKAIEAAKGTLTSAVLGLVLAIVGWFILAAISGFVNIPILTQFKPSI